MRPADAAAASWRATGWEITVRAAPTAGACLLGGALAPGAWVPAPLAWTAPAAQGLGLGLAVTGAAGVSATHRGQVPASWPARLEVCLPVLVGAVSYAHAAAYATQALAPSGMAAAALLGAAISLSVCRWRTGHTPSMLGLANALVLVGELTRLLRGAVGHVPSSLLLGRLALGLSWQLMAVAIGISLVRLALQRAPTPYVDGLAVPPEALADYRLADDLAAPHPSLGPRPPTIFNVSPPLKQTVRLLQQACGSSDTPFFGFSGQPVVHFHGPPGGGKTLSSMGIAQALGGWHITCTASQLDADGLPGLPVAALNAVTALLQADTLGRRHAQPVVLLLDEIDAIVPSLNASRDAENTNRCLGFMLLLHTLRQLARQRSHVVLITTTNRHEVVAPLLQLLGKRPSIYQGPLGQHDVRDILAAQLGNVRDELLVSWQRPCPPLTADEQRFSALWTACTASAFSGRKLRALVQSARRAAIAMACGAERQPVLPQDAFVADVYAAMRETLHHLPTGRHARHADTPTRQATPAPSPNGGARRAERADGELDAEQILQRIGLYDLQPAEVAERLMRRLAAAYVDPRNSLKLAQLKLRFAGTVAQFMQLSVQARWGARVARTFNDVYLTDLRRSNASPAVLQQLLRATLYNASLRALALLQSAYDALPAVDLRARWRL